MFTRIFAITALLLTSFSSFASSDVVKRFIAEPKAVGETARMTYLFWDVYDATLYAPKGTYSEQQPFVLALRYLRDLDGKAIAERSLEEMQKQGFNDSALGKKWLQQMIDIFPDVSENTTLYGVRNASGYTEFYQGNNKLGEVQDPQFTRWFFDIWLGAKTSEPKLRAEILGLGSK